jgi:hypothetical protein
VPGALIVIEIAAPKVSNAALGVLVSACSRAARDAECVLARNDNDAQPAAVAIVTLQSEDKMRVEVGVRQGDRDSWRTKDFSFLAADKSMDRWRAVGFAIGTLAESSPTPKEESSVRVAPSPSTPGTSNAPSSSGSPSSSSTPSSSGSPSSSSTPSSSGSPSSSSTPSSSGSPSSSSPPSSSSTPSTPASTSRLVVDREISASPGPTRPKRAPGTQMFVGAAAIFGPGLDAEGPWRLGSALYGDLAFSEVPLFLTIGGSAATRLGAGSRGVTTRWFDLSLGLGVPLLGTLQGSGLELRAQGFAEYFDAHASAFGRSQTMSRWTLGVQGAFGGRLQIVPDLLLTAELEAAGLSGETEVNVGGESVGSSTSFRYLGSLGLRVRLR